jgi:hypothetical protein
MMGWHPNPPDPGRRPVQAVQAARPPQGCACSWMYRTGVAVWELKFLSAACLLHRLLPAVHGAAV